MSRARWNFEAVKEEALKYKTRVEFRKASNSAYQSAVRNGWLDELTGHCTGRKRISRKNVAQAL